MDDGYKRLGLAILAQTCKQAKKGDKKAIFWLTRKPNKLLELILSQTNLHQDDLNKLCSGGNHGTNK